MPEKIIRDPVHDVIAFDIGRPVDGLLFSLLNSPEFQRLRRILQLGMTHLAYPGATHSRYAHSLGVMETARKMLDRLERCAPINEEAKTLCMVSALVHDLGHGPFSHVFERVSGISHERLTGRLVLDPGSEVHRILFRHDRLLPEKVAAFLRGEGSSPLRDVISSQLDADRFDYLLRDNHMTGSRYGAFDLEWLLHHVLIDRQGGRMAVHYKGISAVEDYLHARYNMYRNVYFHKVVRSAEGMVKLALQRAKRLAVQERLDWPPRDSPVHKALLGQRLSIDEFLDLDDVAVNQCFKTWARGTDVVLARLCKGLLYRRLYKTVDLSHLGDDGAADAYRRARDAVTAAGGDAAYELFYDQPADTPYESYDQEDSTRTAGILVQNTAGGLTPFSELSPLPQAFNQRLMFRRIHVAAEHRDAVAMAVTSARS